MLDRFRSPTPTHSPSRSPAFAQPPRDRWVLVIDDDSAILSLTHDALVAEGLDVVTASSGPIALDLLWSVDHDQPDLIICEPKSVHGSGYLLRKHTCSDTPHMLVLTLS